MDFGVTNAAIAKEQQTAEESAESAWVLTEFATTIQASQTEQTKQIMSMFKALFDELKQNNAPATAVKSHTSTKKKCKHFGIAQKGSESECWELLEVDEAKHLTNWKPATKYKATCKAES